MRKPNQRKGVTALHPLLSAGASICWQRREASPVSLASLSLADDFRKRSVCGWFSPESNSSLSEQIEGTAVGFAYQRHDISVSILPSAFKRCSATRTIAGTDTTQGLRGRVGVGAGEAEN